VVLTHQPRAWDPDPGRSEPVNHILMPEDPAYQRYERLVDALGTGPVHTAFENAAVARIVAWATEGDCTALTRLVRRARRDAFTVGRLNAQQEAREAEGASSRSGLTAARREKTAPTPPRFGAVSVTLATGRRLARQGDEA
jgi:hypothetical protein